MPPIAPDICDNTVVFVRYERPILLIIIPTSKVPKATAETFN